LVSSDLGNAMHLIGPIAFDSQDGIYANRSN
jgi:hypothetical protein